MSLNIGNVTFGVDADVRRLSAAVNQIHQFQSTVTRVANSQVAATQKTAAAYLKQEAALNRAFNTTLKLQQAQQRAGDPATMTAPIDATTSALDRLTARLTAGALSQREFNRATQEFSVVANKAQVQINKLNSEASSKALGKFGDLLRNLESSAVLAIGPLSGLGARIRSIGAIAARSNWHVVAFFGALAGGAIALFKLGESAIKSGRIFEQSMARFKATSGSLEEATAQMDFVIETSDKLGLRIDTSAKAFSRLTAAAMGTSLAGEGIRKIFTAVATAAAALRLDNSEVEGTFRAIEQMMSKGTVQAEELRGQLGERLPGAFRLWAASMGVTTQKLGELLKKGEVFAESDLVKFGEILQSTFEKAALDNVNSFTGSMALLSNAWVKFGQEVNKGSGLTRIFILVLHGVTGLINLATKAVDDFAYGMTALGVASLVWTGGAVVRGITAVYQALKLAATGQWLFNIAVLANPFGQAASLIMKLVTAGALFAGTFFGLKFLLDDTTETIQRLNDGLDDVGLEPTNVAKITDIFKDFKKEVQETIGAINVLNMTNFNPGGDANATLRFFQAGLKAVGMSTDDMTESVKLLSKAVGFQLTDDFEGFRLGLFMLGEDLIAAQEKVNKGIVRKEAFKEANDQLAEMAKRLTYLTDSVNVEYYDKIVSQVDEYVAKLTEGNIVGLERSRLEAIFTQLLMDTLEAERRITEEEKRQKDEAKQKEADRKRAITLMNAQAKAIRNATHESKLLQEKIAAIMSGPDGLRYFEQVTQPLAAFTKKLTDQKLKWSEINAQVAQYRALLEELMALNNEWSQAGVQGANAIGNALEGVLTSTTSLKDGFRSLLEELWKILLRLLIIDPIVKSLETSMSGFMRGIGGGGGGGGGGLLGFLSSAMGIVGAFGGGGSNWGSIGAGTSPSGPPLAHGGPVLPGRIHRITERGPEILRQGNKQYLLSNSKGNVTPLSQGGGTTNITINVPPERRRRTVQQEAFEIARETRRAQARNN